MKELDTQEIGARMAYVSPRTLHVSAETESLMAASISTDTDSDLPDLDKKEGWEEGWDSSWDSELP